MSEKTSHLDTNDVIQTLENLPPSFDFSLDIHEVQAVYTILRYAPMEYLPKSVRIELTKKAIVFDGQLISTLKPGSLYDLTDVLSLSREYIGRSLEHAAVFNILVQYISSHLNLADPLRGSGRGHEVLPQPEVGNPHRLPGLSHLHNWTHDPCALKVHGFPFPWKITCRSI